MKKRIILSSILVIALCVSAIVGSTFALFSSEHKVDVSVTAGYVDVSALVDTGSIKAWSRLEQMPTTQDLFFANGGYVEYVEDKGEFNVYKMTPGDKVQFDIKLTNTSDIAIKYQVIMTSGGDLVNALESSVTIDGTKYDMHNSQTDWIDYAVGASAKTLTVNVVMPDYVGNDMMKKACNFIVTVKAIQADGVQ